VLYLDDVGAEVAKQLTGVGTHDDGSEFEDTNSSEWSSSTLRRSVRCTLNGRRRVGHTVVLPIIVTVDAANST
jgi:hypothetical protein